MGNASGATSTIARIALLAWRVASQARPPHASDPHITAISSAHARPAATTDRNAWRSGASGRSNTNDTNAAVVSTMYALVTRSEERRVGKEERCGGWAQQEKEQN